MRGPGQAATTKSDSAGRIAPLLACLLIPTLSFALPADATAPNMPRPAGVLAAVSGEVRVERPGSTSPLAGAIGTLLLPGDGVRVGRAASATVYLAGGGIVRVQAGSRIEIPKEAPMPAAVPPNAALSSRSVQVLEAGLWVLNDPRGSVLLGAMRGDDSDWRGEGPDTQVPLSPRFETVLDSRPRLIWAAEGPVRIALGRGKDVIWRSATTSAATLDLPDDVPALQAGQTYRWWLEGAEGAPLSEAVPFRVADEGARSDAGRFEKEIATMSGGDDGPVVVSLLRCGYYVEVGAWSRVVTAASDLKRRDPSSPAAARALDGSRQQMRLDADSLSRLAGATARSSAP